MIRRVCVQTAKELTTFTRITLSSLNDNRLKGILADETISGSWKDKTISIITFLRPVSLDNDDNDELVG
jgi:hypothetical protein